IYKFIYEHRHEFRVVKMCQVLGVSRSGYYDWTNRKPSARIVKREGLKKLGIRSITKKKYKATTHSKHQLPVSTNLLNQQFKVSQPGSVWSTDITYVYTKEGWFYLATVMDLFSRRIIGWAMAPRMTKTLVISALNKAYTIQEPREGLVHHSDQGSQYASIEYQNLLREKGIQSSMSRKGNCYDNACIASFHSIIKK
ncbi:IS3 family transposase, partial [Staphylococcus pseudintermedius]